MDRATIDWHTVRSTAFRHASGARTPADTHNAIVLAIGVMDDRHTYLIRPDPDRILRSETFEMPQARLIADGRVAVVRVPGLSRADEQTERRYLDAGIDAVRTMNTARPCGWIVDLRTNSGGHMWPMLAVLAPLLSDGVLGSFVRPDGRYDWVLRNGKISHRGTVLHQNPLRLTTPEPPVAILTSDYTASAAEAALIAFRGLDRARTFGEPTAGFASATRAFELDDGALLLITTAYNVDRTGHRYGNEPIPPDQPATEPETAAATWLTTRPRCS